MPSVIETAETLKRELARRDAAAMKRVTQAYAAVYRNLKAETDALVLEIAGLAEPSIEKIRRLARYKRLLAETVREIERFGGWLSTEMAAIAAEEVKFGLSNSRALLMAYNPPAAVAANFRALDPEAVLRLIGFLSPEGPLYRKLGGLAGWTAEQVAGAIIEGVALGRNPRVIAEAIQGAFGRGLTDALRMTRTLQLYSYREANRASYAANSDVVKGWAWMADLSVACPSCIAMHGTEHGLDETLDDHHNGHCAMVPIVTFAGNPIAESGADWFGKLGEAEQRERLGASKYDAWKEGKFEFADLSTTRPDDIYGQMRVETPLKDLLGR